MPNSINRKIKILHLEDLDSDAKLVERELKKGGINYELRIVDGKIDFINALDEFSPDIILSDHSLPSFNSIEALKIVKNDGISIPFILVTATISEEYAVEIMKLGAWDYILKDRLQRLPIAITSAIEKINFKKEKQKLIDEIVNSEALLSESEQLSHIGSWKSDLIKGTAIWSDEAFRIYGYKPNEVIPSLELVLKHVHPDDVESFKTTIKEVIEKRNYSKKEIRIIDKDGKTKYLHTEVFIERDAEGKPIIIRGFNQDITEGKMAVQALLKSKLNFRTIFENTSSGFLLLDADFNIIIFNKQISEYSMSAFGFNMKVNDNFIDMVHPKRQESFRVLLESILKGESNEQAVNYIATDGKMKWYHSSSSRVLDEEGEAVGICLTVDNITERKQAELNLEQQNIELVKTNSELDRFVYSVSHDLRSPLTSVLGLLHFIETESKEPHTLEYAGMIHKSIDRLDGFIRNILSYSQNKRTDLNVEKITLENAVNEIVGSLKNMPDADGIVFELDIDEKQAFYSDIRRLNIVLENLISNAIKYHRKNKEGRYIKITGKSDENTLNLQIEDNGIGIDPIHHIKIFDMFYRLPGKAVGSGIGLYIVKEIVEKLQGNISVKSEVGIGTSFDLTIKKLIP